MIIMEILFLLLVLAITYFIVEEPCLPTWCKSEFWQDKASQLLLYQFWRGPNPKLLVADPTALEQSTSESCETSQTELLLFK